MKLLVVFAAAITLSYAKQITPGSTIRQCQDGRLECPDFTLNETHGDYEMRTYPAGWWVGTTHVGMGKDGSNSFMKLFNYISGANDKRQKIAMTAPVLTEIVPGPGPNCESTFTTSFYVPKHLWGSIPQPTASDVFLHHEEERTVYVRAFDGNAKQGDYIENAAALAQSIDDEAAFHADKWFTAGYDSPFSFKGRRNEVHFIAA